MLSADYITISVATLCPGNALGVDLYSHDAAADQMRLYKRADYPLEDDDLQRLSARGVRRLFITRGGQEHYQRYLRSLLVDESSADMPIKARIGAMNDVVRDVLKESFTSKNLSQTVKHASKLGDLTAGLICNEDFLAADLLHILHHDYGTFTHSANVAYYAVLLAKQVGLPMDHLPQIATGALLHDLGKLDISDSILCKPGRLDEFEFRQIKQHPRDGFLKLCRQQELSEGQLMMVYQHHERLDGSGYPVGCSGDEIHLWGKLCAVVDVFEAVTSVRPYHNAMPHARALEILERDAGRAFDAELVRAWKSVIESL